jgi:hypothetical protein
VRPARGYVDDRTGIRRSNAWTSPSRRGALSEANRTRRLGSRPRSDLAIIAILSRIRDGAARQVSVGRVRVASMPRGSRPDEHHDSQQEEQDDAPAR